MRDRITNETPSRGKAEPHVEPEIIAPDHASMRGSRAQIQVSVSTRGGHRTYVVNPGPLAGIVAFLILAAMLAILLSAFVILFATVIAIAIALILLSAFRRYFRRPTA